MSRTFSLIVVLMVALLATGCLPSGCRPDPPLPPQPEPQPEPEPNPEPATAAYVAFFYESSELDGMPQEQQAMISGLTFRDKLATKGIHFVGGFDDEQEGAAGNGLSVDQMKRWWAAVKGKPLPLLVTALDKDEGEIKVYVLPGTEDAFWQIVEGPQ